MNLHLITGFLFFTFTTVLPVLAQPVPSNDARAFSEDVQVENQWSSERTDIRNCPVDQIGDPFFHNTSPTGGQWDGSADPGQDFTWAEDLCGVRSENLSGIYESGTTQFVVSHDPRSGRLEIRTLYVPPEDEPRLTWGIGLGWTYAEGRIHTDDMWLNAVGVFPAHTKTNCPDQYVTSRRATYVGLGRFTELNEAGETRVRQTIAYSWPRLHVSGSCNVTYMEKNHQILYKLDLEP